jgi:hypothetical protein
METGRMSLLELTELGGLLRLVGVLFWDNIGGLPEHGDMDSENAWRQAA